LFCEGRQAFSVILWGGGGIEAEALMELDGFIKDW